MRDIVDIAEEELGVELKEISENVLRGYCPFHEDTKTPNLTIYKKTQSWYCFACNIGGDAILLVKKYHNISEGEAREKVYGKQLYNDLIDRLNQQKDIVDYKEVINQTLSSIVYQKLRGADDLKKEEILQILKNFDENLKGIESNSKKQFEMLLKNTLLLL